MRVATVQNRSQSDDSTMVGGASLNSPQEFEFLINVIVNKSDSNLFCHQINLRSSVCLLIK